MYHPKDFKVVCQNDKCVYDVKDREGNVVGQERNTFNILTPTTVSANCPYCKQSSSHNIPTAPAIRHRTKPVGDIQVYRITSEEIKAYLATKAKYYRPDIKLELGVKYCEKKDSDPHRAYTALTIAFSDDIIDSKEESTWYDRIGDNETNVRIIKDVFANFIQKFQYDRKALDDYLKNYKEMERLEDKLGITEAFLADIRQYCSPKRIATTAKESWILFSARAEKVIEDMLENPEPYDYAFNPETKQKDIPLYRPHGRIEIHDVYQINKDVVQYIVYVHPYEVKTTVDPLVMKLVRGEKVGKK